MILDEVFSNTEFRIIFYFKYLDKNGIILEKKKE